MGGVIDNCHQISSRHTRIYLLQNVQSSCGAHLASYSMGTGILSPELKWPECKTDHLYFTTCLQGKHENLTSCLHEHFVTFVNNNIFKLKRYSVRWTASSLIAQNRFYTHREFHFLKNTTPLLREKIFFPLSPRTVKSDKFTSPPSGHSHTTKKILWNYMPNFSMLCVTNWKNTL